MEIYNNHKVIDRALALQSEGKKKESINLLNSFLKDNPRERDIISLIGIILVDDNKFESSIPYLEKAISLKSQSELVYLSLYIAYVKLEEFKKSITILGNYLNKKPAILFMDTLCELLVDLSNGYALTYKDEIIHYAKKNNIDIPNKLMES